MNAAGRSVPTNKIAIFYPTTSLSRQLDDWSRGRVDCVVETMFVQAIDAVRRSVRPVDMVVVDATEDDAQAIDVFSHSVARLGAKRTAVYTEQMHEGLESFVRVQGSLLLFGPLTGVQWEEFFRAALDAPPRERTWSKAA